MRHMLLHAEEVLNATQFRPYPCLPTLGYLRLSVDSIPTMNVLLLKVLSRSFFSGQDRGKILFFPREQNKEKQRVSKSLTRTVCYLPGNHFKHIQFFTFAHTKGKLFLRIGLASHRLSAAFAFMGRSYISGPTCVSKDYQIHGHVSNPARQAY